MSAAPVTGEEFVLRRIHQTMVEPGPPPIILFTGFRPTLNDALGLSIYRESQVSADQVATAGRQPGEYYVARLRVADILTLNLTVVADEQSDGLAGHALIPELNTAACQRDKTHCRNLQNRLARLASQAIVVVPATL